MKIVDQENYDIWKANQKDDYGRAVFTYAERYD